ncbi:hypothetical protein [Sphingobacterium multivorum]|uniref:hypothetical protein n=1 Tax=Sphingobacterium multivorum TaxID=28454 RepID=UPI0028A9E3BD|nr:hypothetical protein [Sphingobacterium multivorum]
MSRQILFNAIEKWGVPAQIEMLQEEATELALAARKQLRKNDEVSLDNLAEEMADVSILMEQMTLIFPKISSKIAQYRVEKLARLERRIEFNDFELEESKNRNNGIQLEIDFPA